MASVKPEAHDHLETMEIPTDPPTADPHTDEQPKGNLLQDYELKFGQLSDDQKFSKLCSDAGLKTVERGQFFITLDTEEGPYEMEHQCRELSLPRNDEMTRATGWIPKNTKIGPVLDVKVSLHQDRYGMEIEVEFLFQDRTASWVRIVNGLEKYVTETTETIEDEERRAAGKFVAKARPRLKPAVTLSSVSIRLRESKWIDVNPEKYHHDCFMVSKAVIRLLRHDQSVHREDDGAVRFDYFLEESKKFDGALQWSIGD